MISVSAFCHLLVTAPAAYALGRLLAAADTGGRAGGSLLVVLASALLAGLPAAGHLLGGLSATTSSRAGWTWIRQYLPPDREARLLAHTLGRLPAPGSAWQALHLEHPGQPVRIHLTDGTTLLGRLPDHPPLDQDTVAPTRAAPASRSCHADSPGTHSPGGGDVVTLVPADRILMIDVLPLPTATLSPTGPLAVTQAPLRRAG